MIPRRPTGDWPAVGKQVLGAAGPRRNGEPVIATAATAHALPHRRGDGVGRWTGRLTLLGTQALRSVQPEAVARFVDSLRPRRPGAFRSAMATVLCEPTPASDP